MHSARPVPARKPACTCLRIRKASRRVTQIYDQQLEAYGLTITQYGLLGHLKALDGISIGALAEALVMDSTTLTRTLKPLETKGWVASNADARDARSRRLHLTATGLAAYSAAHPAWASAQQQIATAMGAKNLARLTETIDLLLDRLAE